MDFLVLTIDRFNQTCVVASSAYWVELNRDLIMQALENLFPEDQIIWMPQSKPLSQDGWLQNTLEQKQVNTQILEAGIVYEVEFGQAQKQVCSLTKGKPSANRSVIEGQESTRSLLL